MKTLWLKIFTFIVFLLGSSSCAVLPRFPQIMSIDTLKIEKTTPTHLIADVTSHIFNPNFFGFRVQELQYHAYVGTKYLGKGEIFGPVHVPAHDSVRLPDEPVVFNYRNLDKILNQHNELDSLPVTFFIKAHLDISPLVPVYYVKTLWLRPEDFLRASINTHNIERLLEISSVRIQAVDFMTSRLSVVLTLKNDFPLAYNIDSVRLKITDKYNNNLGKVFIGQVHVGKFSHVDLAFSVSLDNLNMAISLLGQSIEEDICFYARGQIYLTLRYEHFSLPVNECLGVKIQWLD